MRIIVDGRLKCTQIEKCPFAGIGAFGTMAGSDPAPLAIMATLGILDLVFFALLALPGLAAGYGLLKQNSWARILALVVAIFKLLDFPLGTALAIYAFWVLLQEDARFYFTESKTA